MAGMNESLGLVVNGGNSNVAQGRDFVNMQIITTDFVPFSQFKAMCEDGTIFGKPLTPTGFRIVNVLQGGELVGKELRVAYVSNGVTLEKRIGCSDNVLELSKAEVPNLVLRRKQDTKEGRILWQLDRELATEAISTADLF